MIVKESKFKNVLAFELITKSNTAKVVPLEGGKIASFKDRKSGKEYLLQNPSEKFLHTGFDDDFVDGECCGFDDMFPTIDPVSVIYPDGTIMEYPDHGEVARVSFSYETTENSLTLHFSSARFGYEYTKTFRESAEGGLQVDYRIENRSDYDLDVLWAAHCLVNAEQGGQVLVPFGEGEDVDIMFDTVSRFIPGARIPFREEYFLTKWTVGVPECRKFYFPRKAPEGYLAYRYPSGDVLMMEFDPDRISCIGVWENFARFNGAYCIGFEPCSVGYDTVKNAEKYGQKRPIKKGESLEFFIRLTVKK